MPSRRGSRAPRRRDPSVARVVARHPRAIPVTEKQTPIEFCRAPAHGGEVALGWVGVAVLNQKGAVNPPALHLIDSAVGFGAEEPLQIDPVTAVEAAVQPEAERRSDERVSMVHRQVVVDPQRILGNDYYQSLLTGPRLIEQGLYHAY